MTDEATHVLSDVAVEAIGLVRRGANRSPFFFFKAEKNKEEPMPEGLSNVEQFTSVLADLEKQEEGYPVELVDQLIAYSKPVVGLAQLALAAAEGQGEGEGDDEGEPTEPSLPEVAEMSDEVQEAFAELSAKLEEESKAREQAEEMFRQERHVRRLGEFNEIARSKYPKLPVEDFDQFAVDLLTIHDQDQDLYNRVSTVLEEANKKLEGATEALSDARMFDQYASGEKPAEGNPFLVKVEEVRREQFSDLDEAEGFVKAMDVAGRKYPQLAEQYEREAR